jgi:tetratricopeptide (TPR) repeat protein
MGSADRFTPDEVQRILGLTGKQLDYWDRLRLVSPRRDKGARFYDFRDLIGLRTIKQLAETGVPANRLRRALAALREKLSQVQTPLAELRVLSDGKDVVVESGGSRLKPLSGQFVMNFETCELDERVRFMSGRSADDWLSTALEYEADGKKKTEAIDAYERALLVDPRNEDALINCGTLHYEGGNFERASEYFQRALALDGENALAHFNLGSVLEELGKVEEARRHLRQALSVDPDYSDAHYNLAFVCEKLASFAEAREHWQAYVRLEPVGPWSAYARQRLASFQNKKTAGRR